MTTEERLEKLERELAHPKHRSRWLLTVAVMAVGVGVMGCATPPRGAVVAEKPSDLPTVQAARQDTLSQLKIGMPLDEFKKVLPDAYLAAQNLDTTAYELVHQEKYVTQDDMDRQNYWWGFGSPRPRTERQVLWFYFFEGKLVKWGRPQDWPPDPKLIIEMHQK